MSQALKMLLQKNLKLTSSEPKEDMAPEDNTLSDGRALDQKMIPDSQKTTYNMPHVFCNGGRNSNSRVLLLED